MSVVFRSYRIAELGGARFPGDVLPITPHRARAQSLNPRAQPDDVGLVVAFDADRVVGYLGVLPDRIYSGSRAYRIGWLSAWWADPRPRYTAIGVSLLRRVLADWNDEIGVGCFAPQTRRVYDSTRRFIDLRELKGARFLLRGRWHLETPQSRPRLRPFMPLLKFGDTVRNMLRDLRGLGRAQHQGLRLETVDAIEADVEQFITARSDNELSRRGPAEFTWMRSHPWILPTVDGGDVSRRYHFTAYAKTFEHLFAVCRDETNQMRGFFVLLRRDDDLSVPFACFDASDDARVAATLCGLALRLGADRITTYHQALIAGVEKSGFPFVERQPATRPWIISKKYKDIDFGTCTVQDGDGDCGFF